MIKQIYKNNFSINYKDESSQKETVIILIHGFLETSEIWADFSKELSKLYRVISVDLLGHGNTTLQNNELTMCKYAEGIFDIIENEQIKNAFVIGHSMGGYIALAFAENYPDKLIGLSLLHSSPFADNIDKQENRLAIIERIKNGEKDIICENHVKSVFANDNVKKFAFDIKKAEMIAKSISEKGIIASLYTMKNRKDRSDIIKNLKVPFLYVIGKKDNYIPMEIIDKIEMPLNNRIVVLENSGHQGFVEERGKLLKVINDFINL